VLVLETPAVVGAEVVTVGDVVIVGAGAGSTGVGVGVGVGVSVGVVGTGAVSTGVGVGVGVSGVVVGTTGLVVAAVSVMMVVFVVVVESLRIESFTCGVGFVGGLGGVWADNIAGINAKPAAAPSSRSFIFLPPFGLCD
jgi:hypothetical protein